MWLNGMVVIQMTEGNVMKFEEGPADPLAVQAEGA